jgi:hypothetical protein
MKKIPPSPEGPHIDIAKAVKALRGSLEAAPEGVNDFARHVLAILAGLRFDHAGDQLRKSPLGKLPVVKIAQVLACILDVWTAPPGTVTVIGAKRRTVPIPDPTAESLAEAARRYLSGGYVR